MLVEVATMLVLRGEAMLVRHHHNFHKCYQQYILIGVLNSPFVQVGVEGSAKVVGRWEVGEEQGMVQRPRGEAGEEGGVWQEGGLGQEEVG